MSIVVGFNPIADTSARFLILGSMPGVLSLKKNQYYAHPGNAFWRIMAAIYDFDVQLPYESRVEKLKASGVALWDVLRTCTRLGSLDSAIERHTRVPNDFQSFFQQHPNIRLVGFNGAEAENSFKTFALPKVDVGKIRFARLPSSSPAHAVPLDQKIACWRLVLGD